MKNYTEFKAGDKIAPASSGGCEEWYPFITVLGTTNEGNLLHVRFSNGVISKSFYPFGWMDFELWNPVSLENK